MITNEMRSVTINTYSCDVDTYGQLKQGTPTSRVGSMMVKRYNQTNTSDIRFTDVELIGLTKETISDLDTITIDSINYNVVLVVNDGHYKQVFMKRQ